MSKELIRKCRICCTIIEGHNRIYCKPCAQERHRQQAAARYTETYKAKKHKAALAAIPKKLVKITDAEQIQINLAIDKIGGKYARINCRDHNARMLTRSFSWLMR
jgi:hypothetical protein